MPSSLLIRAVLNSTMMPMCARCRSRSCGTERCPRAAAGHPRLPASPGPVHAGRALTRRAPRARGPQEMLSAGRATPEALVEGPGPAPSPLTPPVLTGQGLGGTLTERTGVGPAGTWSSCPEGPLSPAAAM